MPSADASQMLGTSYEAVFEANPLPMWVFDRATLRFLAVNRAAVNLYGYSRDEFKELTILDIRPSQDADRVRADVESHRDDPGIWVHRTRSGTEIQVEITAHDLDFDGRAARLVLALNVTERERNARRAEQTNRNLFALIETAPVGVLILDSDHRIRTVNAEARRLLDGAGEDPLAPLQDVIYRLHSRDTVDREEIQICESQWAEVSSRAIDLDDEGNGTLLILADINPRRAIQASLAFSNQELETRVRERTSALAATNDELEALCFSVSHDLRGPLRAVDGFAQQVMTDAPGLSETHIDALRRIRRAAVRMSNLIDGMLSLSRLTRAPMEPRWLDLSTLVERTLRNETAAHPDRTFRIEVEPNQKIYADSRLLNLLVEHLVSNAVKFTQNEPVAEISFFAEDSCWVIKDNGAGFDMAYSGHLFQPFERLHRAEEFPGMGLGLAIAQRVIRRHGGTLTGEGEPERGAAFRFSIPTPSLP